MLDNISDRMKGILCIVISSFGLAMTNGFVKLAGNISGQQKLFFKSIVTLIISGIVIIKYHNKFLGHKGTRKFLLARAAFGTLGVLFNFYAIKKMVLSDANMLHKLSPFFIIILSSIFLKETIKRNQFIAVLIAFIGALFIVKPSSNIAVIPALIGAVSGFFDAVAYTFVRFIRKKEAPSTIVFCFSLFSIIILCPMVLYSYKPMSNAQLIYLVLSGIFASVGQFGMTYAFKFAPSKEISIFDYTNIAFSALISLVVFGAIPDAFSFLGYIIIFAASFYIFLYNKNLDKNLVK